MLNHRVGLRLLAALLLVACGEPREGEHRVQVAGAPIEVALTPALSLGVMDGDTLQEFHRVVTPFVLPNGEVVVPQSGTNSIRVFSREGAYRRTLGRTGSGPGEFQALVAAWPRADTVEALDMRLRRIVRFRPDGVAEIVTVQSEQPDLSTSLGAFGDGWALGGVAAGGAGRRDVFGVRWIGRDGLDRGGLGEVGGMVRGGQEGCSGPEPLSPRAVFAGAGGRVYLAESLTPRIEVVEAAPEDRSVIVWEQSPPGPPGAVLREVADSAVARAPAGRVEGLRRCLEGAPTPDRVSVIWGLLVDPEGFVWVREYEPLKHAFALAAGGPGPGGRWRVVREDGTVTGAIEMPPDLEPTQVTAEAVVGIARDELGVEYVRVHALRRH